MKRWVTFVNERVPIPLLLAVAGGVSASELYLTGRFDRRAFFLGGAIIMLFLVLLRVMDEHKDFEKDQVAHPDRPLPRGLLTVADVRRAIGVLMGTLLVAAAVCGLWVHWLAGAFVAVGVGWVWLMYREFYVGPRLADFPMVYALSHQIVIYPMYGCVIALARPDMAFSSRAIVFMAMNLGATMGFEIARKLDPKALPILKTYLSVYGPVKTALLIAMFEAVAAACAYGLGLLPLLAFAQAAVVIALPLMFVARGRHRVVEGLAALSSFLAMWGVAIQAWTGWPR